MSTTMSSTEANTTSETLKHDVIRAALYALSGEPASSTHIIDPITAQANVVAYALAEWTAMLPEQWDRAEWVEVTDEVLEDLQGGMIGNRQVSEIRLAGQVLR